MEGFITDEWTSQNNDSLFSLTTLYTKKNFEWGKFTLASLNFVERYPAAHISKTLGTLIIDIDEVMNVSKRICNQKLNEPVVFMDHNFISKSS